MPQNKVKDAELILGFLLVVVLLLWAVFGHLLKDIWEIASAVFGTPIKSAMNYLGEHLGTVAKHAIAVSGHNSSEPYLTFHRNQSILGPDGTKTSIDFDWGATDWVFAIIILLLGVALWQGATANNLLSTFLKFAAPVVRRDEQETAKNKAVGKTDDSKE